MSRGDYVECYFLNFGTKRAQELNNSYMNIRDVLFIDALSIILIKITSTQPKLPYDMVSSHRLPTIIILESVGLVSYTN